MKSAKILYFIDGPAPTADQIIEAAGIPAKVVFRNARAVGPEGSVENCDGVMGAVPKIYAKQFPDAETAVKANIEKLKASTKGKFKDVKPPASTQQTQTTPQGNQAPTQTGAKQAWGTQPPKQ